MDHGAIVVGGGHNGLICATYLARAGIDTLVVEARSSVGGCASTVDALGARVNICNCDHTMVRTTPVLDELDLARHGLRYLDVDPAQQSLRYDGGPAWPVFHDVERTLDGLRRTYPDQVDGYRRYVDAALPVARLLQELANQPPTPGGALRTVAERRGRGVAHAAALEPDERRRRVRQLLQRRCHQRAGHRGRAGRVGPRPLDAGHRARRPHLRHEARRPGRPAR